MFTAKDYAMPQSLEEAYEVLMARKTNHIIAGCAWLRMGEKKDQYCCGSVPGRTGLYPGDRGCH